MLDGSTPTSPVDRDPLQHGDWVEVQGKHKQGFVNAREEVNRTSGTQYRSAGGLGKGCLIVAYVLIIGFIAAIAISIVLGALQLQLKRRRLPVTDGFPKAV